MSIFDGGKTLMADAFNYASSQVRYLRDGTVIAAGVPAKLGRTLFRYTTPAGLTIRTEQRDFILRYSDLNREPKTGDEIVLGEELFVVSAPNGEPCWRWHSRNGNSEIRIHAKFAGPAQSSSSSSSSSSSEEQ